MKHGDRTGPRVAEAVLGHSTLEAVQALHRLLATEWARESMGPLDLDGSTRSSLHDISAAAAGDMYRTVAVFEAWHSGEDVDPRRLETLEGEVLHLARQGYFDALIASAEATSAMFQKASLLAPEPLTDELARLGARAFERAMRLRKLYVDLFYTDSPFPAMAAGEAAPPGH